MKKLIFASGIIVCIISACSTNKNLKAPFPMVNKAENYFSSTNAIPEEVALRMIKGFPKHKYHFTHKRRLQNTWAMFDKADLNNVYGNSNVDSVKFVLASWTKEYETKKYPTVIMVVYIKPDIEFTFKPINRESSTIISVVNKEVVNTYNSLQYLSASKSHYCPPPDGCTLQ